MCGEQRSNSALLTIHQAPSRGAFSTGPFRRVYAAVEILKLDWLRVPANAVKNREPASKHDAAAPAGVPTESGATNDWRRDDDRRRNDDRRRDDHGVSSAKATEIAMESRPAAACGLRIEAREEEWRRENGNQRKCSAHRLSVLTWFVVACPQQIIAQATVFAVTAIISLGIFSRRDVRNCHEREDCRKQVEGKRKNHEAFRLNSSTASRTGGSSPAPPAFK